MINKVKKRKRVFQNQDVRFAAKLELLAELGSLQVAQKMNKSTAIDVLLALCRTDEKFRRLASLATGRTYSETSTHVSRTTIFRWLKLVRTAGNISVLKFNFSRMQELPYWLDGFLKFHQPSVSLSHHHWVKSGAAPTPPPTIDQVRRIVQRLKSKGFFSGQQYSI